MVEKASLELWVGVTVSGRGRSRRFAQGRTGLLLIWAYMGRGRIYRRFGLDLDWSSILGETLRETV